MPRPRLYRARKPSRAELLELAAVQSGQELSYEPVGITLLSSDPPPGFHRLHVSRDIGRGGDRFDRARAAIIDWAGHRRAGVVLQPDRLDLVAGNEVAMALRAWPLWVTASCRVVEVVDEPDRFGFAYGTLPHHPAAGEESFVVIRDPATDQVRLEITAYSRPAVLLAKLGGPIGRAFQRLMANRYLDGFEGPESDGEPSEAPAFNVASVRWWFENRENGQLTIAQFPNWPLFAIAATTAARWLSSPGGLIHDGAGFVVPALWLYWGADELVRGVNPWRRLLGAAVIGWQVSRLLVT